jgi:uncharacterized membrane protein YraQ (UPF0718 family)
VLLILAIAGSFWGGSRYPSLAGKAAMAGSGALADPLGFEAALHVPAEDPALRRIAFTTVNWMVTNARGMAFGVLLAAGFATLLPILRRRALRGRLANTLLGVSVGAPMGVCVNCAAPIARGMHDAGARLETTLGALFSSPTLNVVVLTIVLSLFPLHMVILKVGATILFLLAGVPLLARLGVRDARAAALPTPTLDPCPTVTTSDVPEVGWASALGWFVRSYPRALASIVVTTVPLMLLSGLLGAAAITLLPWERLADAFEPIQGGSGVLALGGLAAFGLFLPVPIAFDAFICATLLSAGLGEPPVMVLLFTLGIFSIYPFLILGRGVSWRLAALASLLLVVIGVGTGVAAGSGAAWEEARQTQRFMDAFASLHAPERAPDPPIRGEDDLQLLASLRARPPRFEPLAIHAPRGIEVGSVPHALTASPEPGRFTRHDGRDWGFVEPGDDWLVYRYVPPFSHMGGLAAGDVNGDGLPDLVLSGQRGVFLYVNDSGQRFVLQEIDVPELRSGPVGVVALADLDDDGWLDLIFSVFRKGHFALFNRGGRFLREHLVPLPRGPENVAFAAALGDLDRDGTLELVLGNFTAGQTFLFPEESRNVLLRRTRGGFVSEALPGVPGETLSTLMSDIDGDGDLDLLVGNDYQIPDVYYLGDGEGGLREIRRSEGLFPHTTYSTMSIDSADLDNDLDLEIYVGQISGDAFGGHERLAMRTPDAVCDDFANPARRARCTRSLAADRLIQRRSWERSFDALYDCRQLASADERHDCFAIELYTWSRFKGTARYCDLFPARWNEVAQLCGYLARHGQGRRSFRKAKAEYLVQQRTRNVLFERAADGRFADRAREVGVDIAGWTWNARFADLDHDEFQDLFVTDGYLESARRESNLLFRNRGGRGFEEATVEAGLADFQPTGGSVFLDLEGDGDLDIITAPFHDVPWVYRNEHGGDRALSIELRDLVGNRFGIGSQVVIHYGPGAARHQLREMKAGGGFLAFDESVLHFGLGSHAAVQRIDVRWSTGERSAIRGDFRAGARYRITRRSR